MIVTILLALALVSSDSTPASLGAQDPAFAPDGRLAVALRGDLWVRSADGARWTQVTRGAAWDRGPAWSADGSALLFASIANDASSLWRVRVPSEGAPSAAVRVTSSREAESEPAIARDGTIAFVRGRGSLARVWLRRTDGSERRLTRGDGGAERWPAWSPDGAAVAYSQVREGRTRLRLGWVAGDSVRTVVDDRDAERAAWSPDGERLAFVTRAGRAGVWVTTPDARYVNMISARRAAPAWHPAGRSLALVALPPSAVGFNGDPDRVGDRDARDRFGDGGTIWFVDAPAEPDAGLAAAPSAGPTRADRNRDALAATWGATDSLYYAASPGKRAAWRMLRDRFEARVLAAATDEELRQALYDMVRERPTLRDAATGRAAVSSAHPVATAAGLEVLRRGGNAVDAAVAVSFALGVVEPDASGIGGYGQMLVRLAAMERPALIEFMARTPEEATLSNGALQRRGSYPDDGPVLANVPGTVAGMELAWKRYGSRKVAWADVIAPAIRAAEQGYVVSEGLATTLATEREHFLKYPGSRALFFPGGAALRAGDTLRNPDLARTMRAIADSGAAAFYSGDVGRRMVADLRGRGNAMRSADLARYYAAEREPVSGTYRGFTVFSSAPPASGGPALVAQLNMLERHAAARRYTEDAPTLHAMIEAWKLVPASRGRIADPGLWPVRIDAFVAKDSARARWRCFDPARAVTPDDVRGDTLPCVRAAPTLRTSAADPLGAADAMPDEADECGHASLAGAPCHRAGTTSFAVADVNGDVVSVTQTLGTWGGNFYVSPGLGFLYNDKLTSYGADPDDYGARLANARHGSTLAPTIVFRGDGASRRPVLATGAAGNAWITSAVYSIVSGVLDAGLDAQRAIELPRFLLGQQRDGPRREYVVQVEDGFSPAVIRRLESMGHRFHRISLMGELRMGYAAAVLFGEREVTAAADPRRAGEAGAVGCRGDKGAGCRASP